jgi:hypothetical protein
VSTRVLIGYAASHLLGADRFIYGVVKALVSQTTSSRWVGDEDSPANNRGGVCPPGAPQPRAGFVGCASFLVWPR